MSSKIKLGIIGMGRAGWGMHLSELDGKKDKYEVVAVCDILPDRNEKAADRLGCRTCESIDDFLADPEIELVTVATQTCDHFQHAKKALLAGKNVFLEKPACTNVEELKELYTLSNQPGKPSLYVRQNRRFEFGFAEMKQLIESGVLGNVYEIQLFQNSYQRRDDWQTIQEFGGGQLLNWGPHIIDHALRLLGAPVAKMSAELMQATAGGDCEDHFTIRMKGENNRLATLWISGASALNQGRRYVAYGDRGAAEYNEAQGRIYARYIDPEQVQPKVISNPGTPGMSFGASGTFTTAVEPVWVDMEKSTKEDLTVIWDYLYDTLRNGAPFPIRDEEVLALMQVITDAKKSEIICTDTIQ